VLDGGTGNDTIRGEVGDDTSVFSAGEDVAIGLNTGNLEDVVALENSLGIADFAGLQTHRLSLVNGVAAIADAGGNTLTFQGIASLAGFDRADFTF